MSTKQDINIIFNVIVLVGIIFTTFIIIVLINTFTWEHVEVWASVNASLLSVLGILIAAGLVSLSVMMRKENTKDLRRKNFMFKNIFVLMYV